MGFRKLGEQLFSLGLAQRLGLGQRHTAGGDTTAPTVVITCAQSSPSATTPLNFTFTLSEVATDFAIGGITVGGVDGTKSNFAGSGTSYTCDIAPTSAGSMTVDVAAGAFHDAVGNGNTAATQFSFISGFDNFNRSDGDLGSGWEYTAGKWTIATNAAIGTPALGATVNANPGFDSDTGWIKETNWTIGSGTGNKAAGAGTRDLYQNGIVAVGSWYRIGWTAVTLIAGQIAAKLGGFTSLFRSSAATYVDTGRAATVNNTGLSAGSTADGTVDNVTVKLITLADMFATIDFGDQDVDVSVPLTIVSRTQAGIVICLDSKTSPANFIIAYHNGTNARLEKCVAGTYTQLIDSAAAYAAGRILRVVKSGTSVSLYYNGVQIGITQTVSDAGIISNTRHGMFNAYEGNSADSFTLNPT
jgi:hypothetical protein